VDTPPAAGHRRTADEAQRLARQSKANASGWLSDEEGWGDEMTSAMILPPCSMASTDVNGLQLAGELVSLPSSAFFLPSLLAVNTQHSRERLALTG